MHVRHGEWVETRQNGFVEGAWDGDFSDWEFYKAVTLMGSGAQADKSNIIFSTPTHTLERIFSVQINDKLWLSNSLSFCLSSSNTEMDPSFAYYQGTYDSIDQGIEKYNSSFPLKDGHTVSSYVFCNISVNKELEITLDRKNAAPEFSTYGEYTHYLLTALTHLIDNAQDNNRNKPYVALATASRGYDAASVAALAFDAGCKKLFTFANAKPTNQTRGTYKSNRVDVDDSGEETAKAIGYENVLVRDRWKFLDAVADTYEIEACASGNLFYDPSVIYEQDIRQTIFLTGHFGDVIWNRNDTGCKLEGGGISGASLYESRLRIGFIHAPVPYIAATSLSSIVRIANSDEMRPWQLNHGYDRPIPRRILEERKIQREAFGMKKRMIGVNLSGTKNNFLSQMTLSAAESFNAYYTQAKRQRSFFTQLNCDIRHVLFVTPRRLSGITKRFGLNTGFTKWLYRRCKKWSKYNSRPRAGSYLFPWGVHTLMNRYKVNKDIEVDPDIRTTNGTD